MDGCTSLHCYFVAWHGHGKACTACIIANLSLFIAMGVFYTTSILKTYNNRCSMDMIHCINKQLVFMSRFYLKFSCHVFLMMVLILMQGFYGFLNMDKIHLFYGFLDMDTIHLLYVSTSIWPSWHMAIIIFLVSWQSEANYYDSDHGFYKNHLL